jgi:glycosyltransferase involved in cell wall biosynthesis
MKDDEPFIMRDRIRHLDPIATLPFRRATLKPDAKADALSLAPRTVAMVAPCNMADGPSIALLISAFHPRVGGGETHARILGRELQRLGARVTVFTRRHERALPARDEVDGVPVIRVGPSGAPRLGKYLMLLPILIQLIRHRREYDVVYVCGLRVLGLAGVAAARLLGKRCVLRAEACGEWSGEFIFSSPHGNRAVPAEAADPRPAPPAQPLLPKGGSLPRHLARHPRRVRGRRRAAGADRPHHQRHRTDDFTPVDGGGAGAPARRTRSCPAGYLFAYSGKLNRGKGLEMLLRAWESIVAARPQARLVLIGAGGQQFLSCEDELREFVRANGRWRFTVTFTGYTQRVADHLRACDAFVFPSESEALGLALLEAMACGCHLWPRQRVASWILSRTNRTGGCCP